MARPAKKQQINRRARRVLEKPPVLGWRTSDEDELNLRRWRGRTEITGIDVLEAEQGPFGTFRVRSPSGNVYDWKSAILPAAPIPAGASIIVSTGLALASTSKGFWRRSEQSAAPGASRRSPQHLRAWRFFSAARERQRQQFCGQGLDWTRKRARSLAHSAAATAH